MKNTVKKLSVLIVVALCCFVAGEVIVRTSYWTFRRPFFDYDMEMWRYAKDLKRPRTDPVLPFDHYPNREGRYYGAEIKTNSLGFRDADHARIKARNTKRIVVLGDSQTLGWGVAQEDTFAKRLEKIYLSKGRTVDVINMGVGNYNSSMEVELFREKGLDLDPDMVILAYFVNDTEPTPKLPGFLTRSFLSRSYLAAFIAERSAKLGRRIRSALPGRDPEFVWRTYYSGLYGPENVENRMFTARSIRELAHICRDRSIRLLIVNIPELHRLDNYPFPFATAFIRSLAGEVKAPFADMLPALSRFRPETLWVSPEDDHAGPKAHEVIAESIYRVIERDGLLWK